VIADRQLAPLERELRPLARADERAQLLSIPGVAVLLGLTIASEIGDIARFSSARKLVGYSGLTPRIKQSGQSSRVGRLSKAGPDTLRWAAVEASQQAWRPNNPWHELYNDIKRRHGKANPAKAAVARKILIAAWHILSLGAVQAQRTARDRSCPGKLLHSSGRLKAHKRSEKPGQLPLDHLRHRAPKEISAPHCQSTGSEAPSSDDAPPLHPVPLQRDEWLVGRRYLSAESISLVLAGRDDHPPQEREEEVPELQAA